LGFNDQQQQAVFSSPKQKKKDPGSHPGFFATETEGSFPRDKAAL
jgi:hypothetical protein